MQLDGPPAEQCSCHSLPFCHRSIEKGIIIRIMISITKGGLPSYLVGSDFYNSLCSDDAEEFSIPEESLKLTTAITSVDDLRCLMNTLRYWGTRDYPDDVLLFLLTSRWKHYHLEVKTVLDEFSMFPELSLWYDGLQNITTIDSKQAANVLETNCFTLLVRSLISNNTDLAREALVHMDRLTSSTAETKQFVLSQLNASICTAKKVDSWNPRYVAQLIFRMYKSKPDISLDAFTSVLPLLAAILNSTDDSAITDSCNVIAIVCLWSNEFIEAVVNAGLVPRLVAIHSHYNNAAQAAALHAVSNIMTGESVHLHFVVNHVKPATLDAILQDSTKCLRAHREVCFIIVKLVEAWDQFAVGLVDSGLFTSVVNVLQTSKDEDIQRRCVCIITSVHSEVSSNSEVIKAWEWCNSKGLVARFTVSSDP